VPIDTPAWVRDTVFYQVFPDRFATSDRVAKPGPMEPWDAPPTQAGYKGGDLIGLTERLDELVDLGISGLYLNPIFRATSNPRYNAYDYLEVDPLLGGDAAFRELLDAAHNRGIRVILDGVFNHSGRGFWPFQHVIEAGLASPYRDWFYLDGDVLDGQRGIDAYPVGWQDGSHVRTGYRAWWGIPSLPKLRVENPGVREFLFGVAATDRAVAILREAKGRRAIVALNAGVVPVSLDLTGQAATGLRPLELPNVATGTVLKRGAAVTLPSQSALVLVDD
jgi:cyclomaltodextrinase